jgi:hypothetical protein
VRKKAFGHVKARDVLSLSTGRTSQSKLTSQLPEHESEIQFLLFLFFEETENLLLD